MGNNIKDFNSWQRLNEDTFLSWAGGLFTGSSTGETSSKPSSTSVKSTEKAPVDKIVKSISSAFGIEGDSKNDKESKSDKKSAETKFTKFGKAISSENIAALEAAMDRHNITNEFARKAILGVVSKEGANLSAEKDYSTTPNNRIREIYGERVSDLSDSELTKLKLNPPAFWDRVYGPNDPTGKAIKYGNTNPGDGEKYRGRGFNQITFKSNYKNLQSVFNEIGKLQTDTDIDIVSTPELLENPNVAAEFAILYFINSFNRRNKDLNDYEDLESAVRDYVQANAGWGSDITRGHKARGFNKALEYAKSIA